MKRYFFVAMTVALFSVSATAQEKFSWQDTSLPRTERVENLLGMLTPEEKVGLMMNKSEIGRAHV